MADLDCDICLEQFDTVKHRPKSLPCGHTYCLGCLIKMQAAGFVMCPEDREIYLQNPHELRDTFYILKRLDETARRRNRSVRLWCLDCGIEAEPRCEDSEHVTQGLRGYRRQQAESQVQALERLATRHQRAVDTLVAVQQQTADLLQANLDQRQRLQASIDGLQQGLDDWDQHRREAAQQLDAEGKHDQELQLLGWQQDAMCSISCSSGRADGVQLSDQPMLRVALALLRQQGLLQQQEKQQNQQEQKNSLLRRTKPQAPPTPVRHFMSLSNLSICRATEREDEKNSLLQSNTQMQVMTHVFCDSDRAWTLAMLEKHAAQLEELELISAHQEHLLALWTMPRLRKLWLTGCHHDGVLFDETESPVEALGLQFLRATQLPLETVGSLLTASRQSLQELWLSAVTQPDESGVGVSSSWPADLENVVSHCDLRRLVLRVPDGYLHDRNTCAAQRAALSCVLPMSCSIRCDRCQQDEC